MLSESIVRPERPLAENMFKRTSHKKQNKKLKSLFHCLSHVLSALPTGVSCELSWQITLMVDPSEFTAGADTQRQRLPGRGTGKIN